MAMQPWIGYAPDVDPTTPGVMTNCAGVVPSTKGFKAAPSLAASAITATLGGQCQGAALLRKNDETVRLFGATATNIYESTGSAWFTRTGSALNLGTSDRVRFAQFGDVSLAVAKTDPLNFITTASTFAAVTSTAPKASIVEVANNFVLLFDVNDQGSLYDAADRPNGWWSGPKGGYVDFTPSVTTEAATGVLNSTPGKVTGARRFGYQCVAYKLRSMYLGTYVGQPVIWDWQLIPGEAGALSNEAIVDIGTPEQPVHIAMGTDNFYRFAGGRPVPIGNPIKDTVFGELNLQFYYAACALHDKVNGLVRFWYPVASSNKPDKCVVYNYRTDRWGRDDRQIELPVTYSAAGTTYDGLGSAYATYDALPDMPYDLAFAPQTNDIPAVFDTANVLRTLTGPAGDSSITSGDYGDEVNFFSLTGITPRFLVGPDSSNFANFYREKLQDALTTDQTTALMNGRYDFLRSSRWHRGRFDFTGDWEMVGFTPRGVADGEE
jgi:hypothetical protein